MSDVESPMGHFLVGDAEVLGVECAILLWYFRHEFSEHDTGEVRTSYRKLHEGHPYFRVRRIRRIVNELVKMEVLERTPAKLLRYRSDGECRYSPGRTLLTQPEGSVFKGIIWGKW